MEWIPIAIGLKDHPKVIELADILEIHEAQALGHVVALYSWGYQYAINGDLSKHKIEIISRGCKWGDDPHSFMKALLHAKLIDDDMTIHDWDEHTGAHIERQMAEKNRKKEWRDKRDSAGDGTRDVARDSASDGTRDRTRAPYRQTDRQTDRKEDRKTGRQEEERKREIDDYPPQFEEFWAAYPRRIEKKTALRCWNARIKAGDTAEMMIEGAIQYAISCKNEQKAMKYIKLPATFLGPDRHFAEWAAQEDDDHPIEPDTPWGPGTKYATYDIYQKAMEELIARS